MLPVCVCVCVCVSKYSKGHTGNDVVAYEEHLRAVHGYFVYRVVLQVR